LDFSVLTGNLTSTSTRQREGFVAAERQEEGAHVVGAMQKEGEIIDGEGGRDLVQGRLLVGNILWPWKRGDRELSRRRLSGTDFFH
jgi:hypothetical protein